MKPEQQTPKPFAPRTPNTNNGAGKKRGPLKRREPKVIAPLPAQTPARPLNLTQLVSGEESEAPERTLPIALFSPAKVEYGVPIPKPFRNIATGLTQAIEAERNRKAETKGPKGDTNPPKGDTKGPKRKAYLSKNGKFLIEPDIPIPPIPSAAYRTRPMREIEVGWSFFVPTKGKTATKVNNSVRGLEGRRFISRSWINEEGVEGRRIWRTK